MKGKIYKNKLNTTTTNQHLHTDISSISPLSYANYLYQPNSPGSHLLSPKNNKQINRDTNMGMVNRNINSNANNNNNNNKKSFIHELFTQTVSSNNNRVANGYANQQQMNSFVDQLGQQNGNFMTQMNSPTQQSMLKRVVSNPNLGSCQFLVGQNREEIDGIDEASIMDKSSHSNSFLNNNYHAANNNISKLAQKGLRSNQSPILTDPITQPRPLSHLSPSPYHPSNHNHPHSPLFQTPNPLYFQTQPSHPKPINQSDYITSYQKRHKQRVSALESQHQLEIQFYEDELKSRDETIEEMRRLLKEKEDIIKRLQSENASLSSRSYVSFANGGSNQYVAKSD